ncbi:SCA7, zinc-binding domain-domain-containing protein [Leucosporidium creatinivorum]|uniref:SCA7, zinc-binding domain-domain-containing protein n=1 Tax=Leucosporidium creatinivorum TaxID=106004 RepID=A0A1Y2FTX5_9BASI|nr:SCA7, zinc-binding domain-domain-containing protein [Leucosporidium creatinivorum]
MVQLVAQPSAAPSPSTLGLGSPPSQQLAQDRWDQLGQALSPPSAPSPITNNTSPSTSATPRLQAANDVILQCPQCTKPILESAMSDHAVNCQKIRDRQSAPPMKRQLSEASNDPSPSKKPKATSLVLRLDQTAGTGSSGEDSATPSAAVAAGQKKKIVLKEPTATSSVEKPHKTRGPVDVDKHCGVINDKGFPCSRSLTCKTHSMGAKRSVPHRSQPYDLLLAEWTRATKPTSSAIGVTGGGAESGVGGGGVEEGKKKEKKKKKAAGGAGGDGMGGKERRVRGGEGGKKGLIVVGEWSDEEGADGGGGEDGLIDSEEEVEAVLRGLGRIASNSAAGGGAPWGRPLGGVVQGGGAGFSASSMFVGRNVKLARLREALGGLFGAH